MKSILNVKGIQTLSREAQKKIDGGYDTEGRRQSCNVKFHTSLGFKAIHLANEAAGRCGGTYMDYYVI
ncbi:hypothetical protein [uncultured Aquimarina sp.]|uniref:hypothetical protein n=1 Tax=uncultured Aquimarina sp. TaxID=575652 RepID=UPI0026380D0A|nr:hypothetical protein [uncultured Aquimarina sp.]